MYLKSLELHGFKSFPNRTVLTFERGATVIIGPNGSGKSNISDAMRWVLGEASARNIRGAKLEDVIFGGADTRRPMGFAEVTVTFDNTEEERRFDVPYDEVAVTRRYFRTGDSEYYLNKKQVRLRDIQELFMNTGIGRDGYSIIGQGKISEILSRKSEDRRNVFEEAAGIAKFRHRKTETEKTLAATEANMLRLSDIIGELSGRIGPLEKESERAKKYLDLYEQKKRADVSLWLYDTDSIAAKEEAAQNALLLSQHELAVCEDSLRVLENRYDRMTEEAKTGKEASDAISADIREKEKEINALEQEYRLSESETEHTKALLAMSGKSVSDIDLALQLNAENIDTAREKKEALLREIEELEEQRGKAGAERELCERMASTLAEEMEDLLEKQKEQERAAAEAGVRIGILGDSMKSGADSKESALAEIEKTERDAAECEEKAGEAEKTAAGYTEKANAATKAINRLEEERASLNEKERSVSSKLAAVKAERDSASERAGALKRMEEQLEGYGSSVRTFMKDCEDGVFSAGRVYGPLSRLINVKPEHTVAIETALAANIQNIAVDTEKTAKQAIYHLKSRNAGRATFCPVDTVTPQDETAEMKKTYGCAGFVGRADALAGSDAKFRSIISRYLGRTVIFDNLEHASSAAAAGAWRVKIVTLDGQVVNPGGTFTGGSVSGGGSGILSRSAAIDRLTAEADKKGAEAEKLAAEYEDICSRIDKNTSDSGDRYRERELVLTLKSAEVSSYETLTARASALRTSAARLKEDLERISGEVASAGEETGRLEEERKKALSEAARIAALRAGKAESLATENEGRENAARRENDILVSIAEKRRDGENLDGNERSLLERKEELERDRKNAEDSASGYSATLLDLENGRKLNREKLTGIRREADELAQKAAEQAGLSRAAEEKQQELYTRIKEKNAEKETLYVANAKNEENCRRINETRDRLALSLEEDYKLSYSDAVALGYPKVTAETRRETAEEQKNLKNKLRSLGNVNVAAIDEYDEVKKRYDEMSRQYDDIIQSREKLQTVISEIEEEMKRRFSETFNEINTYFAEIFTVLFEGGHAELLLTDPSDLLETGIEIKVAPPGKIVKSLVQLSGGEQALVAIALLFAVLKVNPSPFCIFDEIETALDEVNVKRFARYIKNFPDRTQFILITHRRGTMEAADRMYGVTMPEKGVSKVIGVNVSDFDAHGENGGISGIS